MNVYLTGILIAGGILFSICNLIVIFLVVNLLLKMHRVSKKVSSLSTFFNWDARLLAPIFILKKIISFCLNKRKTNNQLAADLEDLLCEGYSDDLSEDSNWYGKILRKTGLITAIVVALTIFFRKQD